MIPRVYLNKPIHLIDDEHCQSYPLKFFEMKKSPFAAKRSPGIVYGHFDFHNPVRVLSQCEGEGMIDICEYG
ncbi:OLC1v1017765C2 [Oldenlandia corymbosa var. corymbosa]|uniref:OLC1v1017765C2 n=1 Tax=Oldenlandia corymbosa var. corymbosa TaxID=529605 RepID=A0AAV1EA71_OLDCO|nr:OLC1v1017765C2 [Oldenlandia corymbosa var. corymbosa]